MMHCIDGDAQGIADFSHWDSKGNCGGMRGRRICAH